MNTLTLQEAIALLQNLAADPRPGERFVVVHDGRRIADIVGGSPPLVPAGQRLGFMKGKGKVPDDFDTMMKSEIDDMVYGKD